MERIKKALELARQERSSLVRGAGPTPLAAQTAAAAVTNPSREVPLHPAQTVSVSEEALRGARLLLPGMPGDASHGFRLLRTRVLQRMRPRGWNTVAVVSAAPDEGKTFTAINLAIAIAAMADGSALLVDLDLRFPRVYRRLDFLPTVGIEDCLRGDASVADAVVGVKGYPGLMVLPARGPVEHSSELIGSASAREVFRSLKATSGNRITIYDLPPVLATDDALTFIPQVDAVLVVIGEGKARRDDLKQFIELLRDTPVVGTVLNGSRSDRSAEYAY